MRFDHVAAVIRPRSHWAAVDLGLLLLRRWIKPLSVAWFALTFPIYCILCVALYDFSPFAGALVFWWLLPFWERLLIGLMGQAFFSHRTLNIKSALLAFPRLIKPHCFAYLFWRRWMPTRSVDQSVIVLEHLKGARFRKRLSVLHQDIFLVAFWWIVFAGFMVSAFVYGGVAFGLLLLPAEIGVNWQMLLNDRLQPVWLSFLINAIYYLALSVVTFCYVSGGFSLYLNRRVLLEGWDIEIAFRRLAQRDKPSFNPRMGGALLLLGCLCLSTWPDSGYATNHLRSWGGIEVGITGHGVVDKNVAYEDIVDERAVNEKSAFQKEKVRVKQSIKNVLESPPFRDETLRLKIEFDPVWQAWLDEKADETERNRIDWGWNLSSYWQERIGFFLKVMIMLFLAGMAFYLLLRYRVWQNLLKKITAQQAPLTQSFAVDHIKKETGETVDDALQTRPRACWNQGEYRVALGILYNQLIDYINDAGMNISRSQTEHEVLRSIACSDEIEPSFKQAVQQLLDLWCQLAYGHEVVQNQEAIELFSWWEKQNIQRVVCHEPN